MEGQGAAFTLVYIAFAFCFLFTPNDEFRANGGLQALLLPTVASEGASFVQHHVKRTSLTLLSHSALPLFYYMGMCAASPETLSGGSGGWQAFLLLSLGLLAAGLARAVIWSRRRWFNHPICRALEAYTASPDCDSDVSGLAASIDAEFRSVDKFAAGPPAARVIITDTWLLKVTTYRVHVARQSDSRLTVTGSWPAPPGADRASSAAQMLTLRVASVSSPAAVEPFDICLSSTEYAEALERLRGCSVSNAADMPVLRTVDELFLEAFAAQVELNRPYELPQGGQEELEPCMGCMRAPAAVKLVRCCHGEEGSQDGSQRGSQEASECQRCFCRPAWCVSCLGRWFASRQDRQRPETWLAGRVSCPTCRAKFCILDVCPVH